MALDSIAKLSVLITGDESPLAASTRRAEQIVAGSASRMERSNVQLSTVLSAARGNVPALFKTAGAAAVGVLAMAAAIYKLAAAGDRLNEAMGADKLATWAGQWDRLTVSIGNTAGVVGGPLSTAFRDAASDSATWLEQFNNWAFPERMDRLNKVLKANADLVREAVQAGVMDDPTETQSQKLRRLIDEKNSEKHAKVVKEAQERAKKLAEDIAKVHEKERDALSDFQKGQFSRADAIRDMVRTPGEELNRFAIELRSLFTAGFIDQETMNRALEMAEQKARDAVSGKQGAATKAQQGVSAVERFTSAGFTAVQQAQNNMRTQEEHKRIAQQQLQATQQEVNLSQQILQTLSQFPTTAPFALSRLN